jgi:hypothetical protein
MISAMIAHDMYGTLHSVTLQYNTVSWSAASLLSSTYQGIYIAGAYGTNSTKNRAITGFIRIGSVYKTCLLDDYLDANHGFLSDLWYQNRMIGYDAYQWLYAPIITRHTEAKMIKWLDVVSIHLESSLHRETICLCKYVSTRLPWMLSKYPHCPHSLRNNW